MGVLSVYFQCGDNYYSMLYLYSKNAEKSRDSLIQDMISWTIRGIRDLC